ncbi:electron transfer flavoprotein-ubiquinone oxidoreductase [Propionivibrio sp.]|uniref:electron transfer flavoprotein-ubiquinone oxidoreductase n=1 Tax=Propionivibrio sp. TaxID=2212460 RepID=UPI00272EAA3A|nr:electron transfer flavoprotein-ubiquinone oxidoreductase [Propionivibrio sp.]
MTRESMSYDVLIVGGGPAGLAAAIRIKQVASDVSVCLIEKSAEIGGHILSGTIMDPGALDALSPDWREQVPGVLPVCEEHFLFLHKNGASEFPGWLLPACFHNDGNFVLSLSNLCRWLGQTAEALGVEIYPGFAGTEVLYNNEGAVIGVATGDVGRLRNGDPGPAFQPGMELLAHYTLFAEGSRGHLGKQLEKRFDLRATAAPQLFGLGIKEVWEIPADRHRPGCIVHTAGWPLDGHTYGGGFLYHQANHQISVGFVTGLGYTNPYLSPFGEFQRFKTHPALRGHLEGGKRIAYGARTITSGGLGSLPRLVFRGGALIGDDAGFLNAARTKGSHGAILSGMLAAEACVAALGTGRRHDELTDYPHAFRNSALYDELFRARNFKSWLDKGVAVGGALFAIEQHLFRGKAPWTPSPPPADCLTLRKAADSRLIAYPAPDGVMTFDRPSSVYLSSTAHEEDQPCHLRLHGEEIPIEVNLRDYDSPEQRYCPAGVFEIVIEANGQPRLQINASNCLHCKACDIKDPTQNIDWIPPQGGEGPNYTDT